MSPPVKIGFVLLSSTGKPVASTRIAVLNMLPLLRNAGFEAHIVYEPSMPQEAPDLAGLAQRLIAEKFQIVVFQKVHGASVLAQIQLLRAAGIKTVFSVCDVVEPDMVAATDITLTVTDYLKDLHPPELQPKIAVVHDGVEHPEVFKTDWGQHRGSRAQPLRAVMVSSLSITRLPVLINPPDWLHVTVVGRYPAQAQTMQRLREVSWQWQRKADWREKARFLRFLGNPRISRVAWDAQGVYQALQQADIGIIPIETDPAQGAERRWRVKSENRLTLKMAVGLPVIATPVPAYEPVVRQGENGFLASSRADWLDMLSQLREPVVRSAIGQAARQTALAGYSMERQAESMLAALQDLIHPTSREVRQ